MKIIDNDPIDKPCIGELIEEQCAVGQFADNCQIVWHSILLSCHIRDPIVTIHIVDTKEVQTIHTKPNITED